MEEPICARCKVTSSLMWEKNKDGEVLCLECHSSLRQEVATDRPIVAAAATPSTPSSSLSNLVSNKSAAVADTLSVTSSSSSETQPQPPAAVVTGRRTRLRNAKGRYGKAPASAAKNSASTPSSASSAPPTQVGGSQSSNAPALLPLSQQPSSSTTENGGGIPNHSKKGGVRLGRRSQVLRSGKPSKAPIFDPTILTSDTVLHKGIRYEVGDIVSILDENGRTYYALLRGFLEDQYGEMYAALTWLVPTTPNPKDFDPSLFVLGPEEDSPKDMECLDFVTHSPQSASFLPSLSRDLELERLWSGRKRRRIMFTS